jgi:hypothetical protein
MRVAPVLLQQLAKSAGVQVEQESIVEGGATFSIHWAHGLARPRRDAGSVRDLGARRAAVGAVQRTCCGGWRVGW